MNQTPLEPRRWTRTEYARLGEAGLLDDQSVELIGGDLIVSEPKGTSHATAVRLAAHALRAVFGAGWIVCVQDPMALDDESEPEPDVSVVRGELRDYRHEHPSEAALIAEIAESSLDFDRRRKGSLTRAPVCATTGSSTSSPRGSRSTANPSPMPRRRPNGATASDLLP